MRFINIDSEYYNADYIQSYYFTTGQKMRVFFKDGEPKTVDAKNRRYWEAEMSGAAYVVQVIPCETPVWAVWVNDDDTHYAERVTSLVYARMEEYTPCTYATAILQLKIHLILLVYITKPVSASSINWSGLTPMKRGKPMLKLLEPTQPFDYLKAYARMLIKWAERNGGIEPKTPYDKMQFAYLVVKAAILRKDGDDLDEDFQYYQDAMTYLASLTPLQLVTTFPPEKIYDGKRWQCKDYYSTMEAVNVLRQNEPIGEAIFNLLCDYQNEDIRTLMVKLMCVTSAMYRAQTGKDMLVEFFEQQGTPLTTYRRCKDPVTGQEYMLGSDGRTHPIEPRLRLI